MIFPTVHLNGSNRDDLLEGFERAHATVAKALVALAVTGPNARDYYVNPDPQAFYKAQDEHSARMQKLVDVQHELEALAEHLALGPDNFGRRS